jgi:membrane fusion protein, copper/silver efflux system
MATDRTPSKSGGPPGRYLGWIVVLALIVAGAGGYWFYESRFGEQSRHAGHIKYHCPMHPTIIQDKPGDCPICGMKLEPFQEQEPNSVLPQAGSTVTGRAVISLTPESRQRMGLTLGTVEMRELTQDIRTSARITADETKLYRVTTKVEGWVDKLMVGVTGQSVAKGDALLTIYSPQLVSAEREYLAAVQSGNKTLVASARQRLELWDISAEQVARLEQSGEVTNTLTLYAPAGGFVIEKQVLAGQRIMPGDSLMVIADLSSVWADADVYESDLPYVKLGMPIEVTLPYWPDKAFQGKVSFVAPRLDPQTRTIRVRLDIPNSDLLLKPDMYGDAKLHFPLGRRLAAPHGAVMRTGQHTYAFRDAGDGKLMPVEVKVGARSGDYFEVLSGLAENDHVVTSANFLVDSESSMRAALEGMKGP